MSGTTCCTVLIYNYRIVCGNIGDSRAIVCRQLDEDQWQVKSLSTDHKPELAREQNRITEAGGRVAKKRNQNGADVGIYRVWKKHEDVPGLAMTRSFGDLVG